MALLDKSWIKYKDRFIQSDGRVIDHSANQVTTSEGQSYAMLRAAWLGDQASFNTVWSWTQKHLKREDKLFAWKWGQRSDGVWGILDKAAATDADQDIAYALLIGADKWKRKELRDDAVAILHDIWSKELVQIGGRRYVTASDSAPGEKEPKLNPSYFSPYEYREFARVDPQHDWAELIDTSYDVLQKSSQMHVLKIPPDWCNIRKTDGAIVLSKDTYESDYSYDAMRTPWRVALDYKWFGEKRARALLEQFVFLRESWRVSRTIRSAYTASGVMRSFDEPLSGFGCVLPMVGLLEPEMAQQILQERIMSVYYDGLFRPEQSYYDNNWAWFGLAAYVDFLRPPAA